MYWRRKWVVANVWILLGGGVTGGQVCYLCVATPSLNPGNEEFHGSSKLVFALNFFPSIELTLTS